MPTIVAELLHIGIVGRTYRRPCEQCDRGPRDVALAVRIERDRALWLCHRCHVSGVLFRDGTRHTHAPAVTTSAPPQALTWSDRAEALWRATEPLAGTLAARYLERRGCRLPPADGDLRFLAARGENPAAMVGRITDFVSGEPMSLHFTMLDPAGVKLGRRMLAGHRKRGGVIRLWPDECVTRGLGIAEGIETGLALAHEYTPVWSAIDAGNLAALPVVAGIETLVIATDHDDAGLQAAARLGQRWADAGREVRPVVPDEVGADLADVVAA